MDRHDIPGATAKDVAKAHQQDLSIQDDFDCRALTYWFDEEQGMAFCLIEAPDRQSVQDLHDYAHGLIPNEIIEVEPTVVESFLGRINDPEVNQKQDLPVINDPAFRSILFVQLDGGFIDSSNLQSPIFDNRFLAALRQKTEACNGLLVEASQCCILSSFPSVDESLQCAVEILDEPEKSPFVRMGISAGVPVSGDGQFFQKTVEHASSLTQCAKSGQVVLSTKVSEMANTSRISSEKNGSIRSLSQQEDKFIKEVVRILEEFASYPSFGVSAFGSKMGMSKSKLYRQMTALLGMSPNDFIKEFKLRKALQLISEKRGSISEVAFESGFNSLSYFSKCFQERFDLLPSEFSNHAVQ
ncbi:MAG: DUF4242 domain-containing protein [Owenweeksia sp.]|nr:DUF4242 domain-containing protein [Owenweeksia sp.]